MAFHRRNLPHLYFDAGRYFVTYRLANSIPVEKLHGLAEPGEKMDFEEYKNLFLQYDALLEPGAHGENYLEDPRIADISRDCLEYPDSEEYELICYCIIPNHIHVVFELLKGNRGLSKIMQSVKGVSSRKSNKMLHRKGQFWQSESFDRLIRNNRELKWIIKYVLNNPVYAGFVNYWEDWKYTYCNTKYLHW
jgi:REP element-mobilizing transposase RayT